MFGSGCGVHRTSGGCKDVMGFLRKVGGGVAAEDKNVAVVVACLCGLGGIAYVPSGTLAVMYGCIVLLHA